MSTNLKTDKPCPNCGKPLPAGALAGLCPACLLAQGTATDAGEPGGAKPFQPPPLEEVARLFPQLEILSLLGAGGMGAVYKARQPALDRFVALKILPATSSGGVSFAERFNREARALARLSHPSIVAVHEFGQAGALHYFIMEFVDGANLRQLEQAGRLSPREALQIIPQICDALQYAHDEGVVHRDIKPENVLVDRKGRVKIADFGLAKILGYDPDAARLTAEGQVMGTPHYMAPEQMERPLSVDHRADIYSLGVVFYEMLTGDLPLGKFSPPSRKVQVDVRFDEIVLRALENDPERRYQHASEVKTQVETIAGSPAVASPAPSPAPPRTGRRYLHWAGFPVVVEYDGEREVSWNGTLSAVVAAFLFVFIGFVIVRFVTGSSNHPGTLPICLMMAVFAVLAGVRRTLNQPPESELARAPGGTLILQPKRRWNRQYLVFVGITAFVVGWSLFTIHWLGPQLRKWTGNPVKVAQVATRDPQSSALIAEFPGGGTVELLAVAERNGAPNQWWRPDGTLETNAVYELPNPAENFNKGRVSKDLLFRVADLPDGADGPFFEADPESGCGYAGQVYQDGKILPNVLQARFTWLPATRKANVRAGVALVPWRTVSTYDVARKSSTHTTQRGDPRWGVIMHSTADGKEGAQITMILGREHRDWRTRVIAVDTNTQVHVYRSASGTPSEGTATWTYNFPGLPLAAVKEFRVEVRPVHWIEFRNVALQPRSPLPPPQKPRFSEVMEHTFDELIDFDTGRIAEFPPGQPGRPPFAGIGENVLWAQKAGLDAAAGTGELHALDLTVVELTNSDWDTLTPNQLWQRLYLGQYRPSTLKLRENGQLPATFGFRTREGGTGLLQLVTFDPEGPGATVRFKRILRAGDKMPLQAKLDPQTGDLVAKLANGGSVAFVAIKSAHDVSDGWRRADGARAIGINCSVDYPQRLSAVEAQLFDLLFRLEKLPEPTMTPVFEFAGAIRSSTGDKETIRGRANDDLLPVQVVWPNSKRSASARVGIPRAGWHTIRSIEPISRGFTKTRIGDDPKWEIEMHAAGVGTKGAQITVVYTTNYPGWNLRVLASRSRLPDVTGILDAAVTNGPAATKTYVFPGLLLKDVQNFQVQAQPLEWVEFRNLKLARATEPMHP
ncbi:MAG: serine/threonine protein kinase [Verrucomicrobiae bacterium]|nr:serine/threonine protein kinase [Verrucomicrobiae bacterium]